MDNDQDFTEQDLAEIDLLECLVSKFGVTGFRHMQKEIIDLVMNKRQDVCAVMATGHGKSLCFEFPAVYKNGITLVISPLISLMEAQVYTLSKLRISACLLGSAQADWNILQRIDRNEFRLIYCCPEYLQSGNGQKLMHLLKNRLTLIAIDEAHSISQWGHDFRKDYRKLAVIRETIPNVPILAVTATATEAVRQDIITMVGLNAPRVIVTSFDRQNLEYIVHRKSSMWNDLRQWIQNVDGGSVVIYTLKIAETDEISAILASHGIESVIYHASLPMQTRSEVVQKFLKNEIKVIVATIAFGMGIDKPDVRLVIHYGASKNLLSYSQEVGRAGRDGLPSKVVTYFAEDDFGLQEYFLTHRTEPLPQTALNHLRGLGAKFRQYLYSTECRRKTILDYFGEDTSCFAPRQNCCDNCARGLNNEQAITPPDHTPQTLQPYRYRHSNMHSIVDMFFGDCVFCDHGHDYNYDSDEYDENGTYDEAGDDRSSSQQSEPECTSDSDQRTEDGFEERETNSDEGVSDVDNVGEPLHSSEDEESVGEVAAKRRRIS